MQERFYFALSIVLLSCLAVAAAQPPTDVPRIAGIAIDGHGDDWGRIGFRVDCMSDLLPSHRKDLPPTPEVRVGWDDQGLLLLVTTHDNTPTPSGSAHSTDSVEFTFGSVAAPGKGFQLIVTPGVHASRVPSRTTWIDRRADTSRPLTAETATTDTAAGFIVEARVPWSVLDWTPAVGGTGALQVQVNDAAVDQERLAFGWASTTESHWLEPRYLNPVRLAETPATAVRLAAFGEYQQYRRTQVRISDVSAGKTTVYTLTDGDGQTLFRGPAAASRRDDGFVRTTVYLPMPASDGAYGTLTLTREATAGTPAASVAFTPALPLARKDALASVEFRFDTTVFAGTEFPDGDFADAIALEDLIGPYVVTRQFFDADLRPVQSADKPGRYGAVVTATGSGGLSVRRQITLYHVPDGLNWRKGKLQTKGLTLPADLAVPPATAAAQQQTLMELLSFTLRSEAGRSDVPAVQLAALAAAGPGAPGFVTRTGAGAQDEAWWYRLDKKLGTLRNYPYVTVLPDGYDASVKAGKTFPLLVFLHGSGQRGTDPSILNEWGPMGVLRRTGDNPFVVVAPQCPPQARWNTRLLNDLVDRLLVRYQVDRTRIYVTGLSLGGFGAWQYAAAYPERVAAIAPVCGIGDVDDMARLKDVPVWAFHGEKDPVVDCTLDQKGVDALRAFGGDVRWTPYPDGGHEIWDRAYHTNELYAWMLSHHRPQP